jgi:hypothetical protein
MTVTQAADGFTGDSGLLFTSNIGFGTTLGLPTATSGNAGEYFYVQPGNGAAADASSDGQPSGGFHVSSGNGGAGCATCNSGGPRIPGDGGSVVLSGGNAGADGGSGLPAAGGLIALFGGAGTNGGLRGPIFIGTSSLVEIGFSGSPTQIDDTLHVIGASTFSGNAQFSGQIVGSLSFLKENNHQISVDSSTAANVAGGSLNIAAGTPTSGNANGGTLFLDAAYGIGAGVRGNISIGFGNGATASAANVSEYAHDLAQIVVNNVVVFTSDTSGTAINAPGATSLKIGLSTNNIGFFGASGTTQQTIQPLVNNVTVGGTTDTIDDFTSLTVYSVDAPAIRNDIYQLARKVQQLEAAMGPTSGYSLTKH